MRACRISPATIPVFVVRAESCTPVTRRWVWSDWRLNSDSVNSSGVARLPLPEPRPSATPESRMIRPIVRLWVLFGCNLIDRVAIRVFYEAEPNRHAPWSCPVVPATVHTPRARTEPVSPDQPTHGGNIQRESGAGSSFSRNGRDPLGPVRIARRHCRRAFFVAAPLAPSRRPPLAAS